MVGSWFSVNIKGKILWPVMSGDFLIPLYLSTSFYFHLRIITSWPWETGSILSEPLWCWNLPTRCQHSNFLTNHWASWGGSHIPRSWEAGYNLFDLWDQLGSASQQLNTGYGLPCHGEYWIYWHAHRTALHWIKNAIHIFLYWCFGSNYIYDEFIGQSREFILYFILSLLQPFFPLSSLALAG